MPLSLTGLLASSALDAELSREPEAVGTRADNWLDSGVDAAEGFQLTTRQSSPFLSAADWPRVLFLSRVLPGADL